MWGEILGIPTVVHGQLHGESSQASRALAIGTGPTDHFIG